MYFFCGSLLDYKYTEKILFTETETVTLFVLGFPEFVISFFNMSTSVGQAGKDKNHILWTKFTKNSDQREKEKSPAEVQVQFKKNYSSFYCCFISYLAF